MPNAAPIAANVSESVHAGSWLNVFPSATDADNDPLVLSSHGTPANGIIVWMYSDAICYSPNPGFVGTDSFSYTITDGNGGYSTATMTVNVWNTNPTAQPVSVSVHGGQGIWIYPTMADADGDQPNIISATSPSFGNLTTYSDSFYYMATPGSQGVDTITFTVSDGVGGLTTANMSINVLNDPPVAANDSFTVDEDGYIASAPVALFINDTQADTPQQFWTAQLVTDAANGTLVLFADGGFAYVPDRDWNGTDTFTYRIWDGHDYSNEATVTITVNAMNDNPESLGEVVETDAGSGVTVTPTMTDIDGDTPSVLSVGTATHGTAVLNTNGSITYTPSDPYWFGSDSFSYEVSDGSGGTVSALLVILVNATPAAEAAAPVLTEAEIGDAIVIAGCDMGAIDSEYNTISTAVLNMKSLRQAYKALNTDANFTAASNAQNVPAYHQQVKAALDAYLAAYSSVHDSMLQLSKNHGELLLRTVSLSKQANATNGQKQDIASIQAIRPANIYNDIAYRNHILDD